MIASAKTQASIAIIFKYLEALGLIVEDLAAERILTVLTGVSEKSVGLVEFDIQNSD